MKLHELKVVALDAALNLRAKNLARRNQSHPAANPNLLAANLSHLAAVIIKGMLYEFL
jgi:hypothetical protein